MESKVKNRYQIKDLVIWIVFIQFISFMMGMMTTANIDSWYKEIHRSSLTPQGYVFGIVWPVLYLLIAIAGWRIWNIEKVKSLKQLKYLYITQMLLNWLWTPVFFGLHYITVSLIILLAMILSTVTLCFKIYKIDILILYLLMPYALWQLFAAYLNFYIVLNN